MIHEKLDVIMIQQVISTYMQLPQFYPPLDKGQNTLEIISETVYQRRYSVCTVEASSTPNLLCQTIYPPCVYQLGSSSLIGPFVNGVSVILAYFPFPIVVDQLETHKNSLANKVDAQGDHNHIRLQKE